MKKMKSKIEKKDKIIQPNIRDIELQNGERVFVTCRNSVNLNNHKENTSIIELENSDEENSNENNDNDSFLESLAFLKNVLRNTVDAETNYEELDHSKLSPDQYQINTNARFKENYLVDKERFNNMKQSLVYCVHNNMIFRLKFYATNVKMIFLKLEYRKPMGGDCDKVNQSKNIYRYARYLDIYSNRFWLTKKIYYLNYDNNYNQHEKVNRSSTAAYMPSLQYEKTSYKGDKSISRTEKLVFKSVIYLTVEETTFMLNPSFMQLNNFRGIQEEELPHKSNSEIDTRKNRGTFIVSHCNDVLKFQFDIENAIFEQIWSKISRATQCEDSHTYISHMTVFDRKLHCAIPLTTYKYFDPMLKIRYKNHQNVIDKICPKWMKEERQKRLERFCKIDNTFERNEYLFSHNQFSVLNFENHLGTICKAKIAHMRGTIISGLEYYERMAFLHQVTTLDTCRKPKNDLFMSDPKYENLDVLDFDLSVYDI